MKNCKRGIAIAAMLLIAAIQGLAQTIVGTVTDAKNYEPLIGYMVSVKGTD